VPFFVALPSPTIDWKLGSGDDVPIETRASEEVLTATGRDGSGQASAVMLAPAGTRVVNYAFDVTPARLVTGLITERGIARSGPLLEAMFRERPDATMAKTT